MNLSKKIVWLSLATTTMFTNLSANGCNELSYNNSNNKESLKTIEIKNNIWSIWEYTVEIKNKIVKIFIKNSDSLTTTNKLINLWNWECKVWRLLSVK